MEYFVLSQHVSDEVTLSAVPSGVKPPIASRTGAPQSSTAKAV